MRSHAFPIRPWWLAVPLLTVGNQACMKLLAGKLAGVAFGIQWLAEALQTPWIAGIVLCEIASFVLWMRILSTVDVSRAVPLTAIAYVLILLLGWFGFSEPILPLQLLGSVLILTGVSLISTTPSITLSKVTPI